MTPRGAGCAALALGCAWLTSCRHVSEGDAAAGVGSASYVVVASPEEANVAGTSRRSGEGAEAADLSGVDYFQAPAPLGILAAPRYPRELLRPGARSVVLTIIVRVGADGSVREVFSSPAGLSTAGANQEIFLAAVREAATAWRFEPALVLRASPPREPGALPGLRSEKVESQLELQFTFVP